MIKKIILIILLFTYQSIIAQDTLRWSPSVKLSWKDFKSVPDSLSGHEAVSNVQIKYSYFNKDSKFTYNIFCFFNTTNSWVKDTSVEEITHEQGHFDIGEIFARKFRKEMAEYKFNSTTVRDQFRYLSNKIKQEEADMDSDYDKETDNHHNSVMQTKWNEKMTNDLNLLKEFGSKD